MGPRRSPLRRLLPQANRTNSLQCEAESEVDAGKRCVAQVIHAVYLDNINVLGVEPIVGPGINESERVAAVLEAVITVIARAYTKRVLLSKVGLEFVCGNAAASLVSGVLLRRVLLCRLTIRLLLLCILRRRRGRSLLWFCGLFWLRFFLFLRLGFGFLFFLLVLLLCKRRSRDSESQGQNCCAD